VPIDQHKQAIRQRARAALAAAPPESIAAWSAALSLLVADQPELAPPQTVMAFLPVATEPDLTSAKRTWLSRGQQVCLPRVDWAAGTMLPVAITSVDQGIAAGRHGLREPAHGTVIDPKDLRAVIVPGLAFDEKGNRLGRGGGFYDRFLATTPAFRIGVCFEVQLAPSVPAGPLDVPMDAVVTERRVIRPSPPRR
jgi:5-formyltetrahydrofolate cyclo-ligase